MEERCIEFYPAVSPGPERRSRGHTCHLLWPMAVAQRRISAARVGDGARTSVSPLPTWGGSPRQAAACHDSAQRAGVGAQTRNGNSPRPPPQWWGSALPVSGLIKSCTDNPHPIAWMGGDLVARRDHGRLGVKPDLYGGRPGPLVAWTSL